MKTEPYSRTHSFASGLAAAAVTTVLVASLVESFEPAQLFRLDEQNAAAQIAVVDARRDTALDGGA